MLLAPYISVIARAAYPMIHRIIFGVVPHPLQPAYWITYIVFKERFCSLASKHSGTIATGAVTGIHLIFGGISSLFYTIGDKIVNRHEQRSQTSEHSSEIADLPQLVPKQPSPILSDQRGWSTRFLNLFQDTKKTVIDSDEFVMLDMDGTATMAMASARKEL